MSTNKESFPPNPLSKKEVPDGYVRCSFCNFITRFPGSLIKHMSRYHESKLASIGDGGVGEEGKLRGQPSGTAPRVTRWGVICNWCGTKFEIITLVNKLPPFTDCPACQRVIPTEALLVRFFTNVLRERPLHYPAREGEEPKLEKQEEIKRLLPGESEEAIKQAF